MIRSARPRSATSVTRVSMLILGDGCGGDAAAVVLGRVHGEPAPTGADLQQMVVLGQSQKLAETLELCVLGLLEGHLGVAEQSTAVRHRRIEEQREEVVAEVIVRSDVAFVLMLVRPASPAQDIGHRRVEPIPAAAEAIERTEVADHELHEAAQIIRVPPAVEVALAEPRASLGDNLLPHRWCVQPHRHVEVGRLAVDRGRAVVLDHRQPAVIQAGSAGAAVSYERRGRNGWAGRRGADVDRADRACGVGRMGGA